jgi:hypothetical protein
VTVVAIGTSEGVMVNRTRKLLGSEAKNNLKPQEIGNGELLMNARNALKIPSAKNAPMLAFVHPTTDAACPKRFEIIRRLLRSVLLVTKSDLDHESWRRIEFPLERIPDRSSSGVLNRWP